MRKGRSLAIVVVKLEESMIDSISRWETFAWCDLQQRAYQLRKFCVLLEDEAHGGLATLDQTEGRITASSFGPVNAAIGANQLARVLAGAESHLAREGLLNDGFNHGQMLDVIVRGEKHLTRVQLHEDASNRPQIRGLVPV